MLYRTFVCAIAIAIAPCSATSAVAQANRAAPAKADPRLEKLKSDALVKVEGRAKLVQEIVDMLFSFGELGMQEVETSKYLTGILEKTDSLSNGASPGFRPHGWRDGGRGNQSSR